MSKKVKNTEGKNRHRISKVLWVFYCIFLLTSIVIIARIADIQNSWEPHKGNIGDFTPKAQKVKLEPLRGSILDCKGRILATSTPLYTIRMDTHILLEEFGKGPVKCGKDSLTDEKWRELAYKTCEMLPDILNDGRTCRELYDSLITNRDSKDRAGRRDYLFISKIDNLTLKKIEKLPLFRYGKYVSGMKIKQENSRIYPYEELGRRVIGDIRTDPTDPDRNRYVGIEGQYDYILHGTEGYQWMKETDKGEILHPDSTMLKAVDGQDIITTIDINIQDIADRALRKHIENDENIAGGCVVVMDVKSGAVKAMANLSRSKSGKMGEILNLAIGRPGEPGSIFKTITLTTLLEDGTATLDTEVETNKGHLKGFPKVFDKTLANYERNTGKTSITVREGFKRSSNNVFKRLVIDHYGAKEDRHKFTDRLFEYKLQDGYTFDIKENAYGESKLRESWSIADLHSTAIGYSIVQTPLNILMFYNAIANGGKMMKPYLIDSFMKDGKVEKKFEPEILNGAICSKSTCDTLTAAMKKVTSEGTAKRLKNAKSPVAGKTGTAYVRLQKEEKPKPDNPYRAVDGRTRQIASFVGYFPADAPRYSAIVTIYTELTDKEKDYAGGKQPALVMNDIVNYIWALDTQWDKPLQQRSKIPVMKEEYIGTRRGGGPVPDVTGMGLKDAMYALENNGYVCEYEGVGHVVKQSPKAGEKTERGETVKIELK